MPEEYPSNLEVKVEVKGVVLPSWLSATLVGAFVVAVVTMMIMTWALLQNTKEIRLLDLHTQDIENVLIRQGIAKRGDFAGWVTDEQQVNSHAQKQQEDEANQLVITQKKMLAKPKEKLQ